MFELRGHGRRPGPCTLGIKEVEDARSILTWTYQQKPERPLPVGVLGLSMGAAIVCQLAEREPQQVRAVVTDSAYSRFFPILKRNIWRRYHVPPIPAAWITWWTVQVVLRKRLSRLDPAALAPTLHQPLLAIQGGTDTQVPVPLAEEFYRRWAGPKEQWFDPAVGHVQMATTFPERYADRVAAFFDRTLPDSPHLACQPKAGLL